MIRFGHIGSTLGLVNLLKVRIIALGTNSLAWVGMLLLGYLSFSAGIATAGIYQWTDAQGRVHFGDKPNDKGAQELIIESSKPSVVTSTSADDAESRQQVQNKLLDLMDQERQQKKQAKAERKAEKIEQQRRCTILRQELADMLSGGYLYFDYNEAGEREFIDDAAHQQRVDEMRETIKSRCD